VRIYPNLGLLLGTVDREGLQGLKKHKRVRGISAAPHLSLIRPLAAADSNLTGDVTWGLDRLEIPKVWERGFTGKGVLVGHLDTGVDGNHPALKSAIANFAEFDMLGDAVPGATPHDSGEHGTHTAGTIVGRKVESTAFGVAPEAKLASAMVIEGGNVIARILAGMDWVVGLGVRVVSMSLGVRGYQEDFLAVVRTLRARGILPVFAVGNEGPGTSRSPGNYPESLSVGASDSNDEVASFSSSQRFVRLDNPLVPDLVGPGVDIVSSVPDDAYKKMSGSSMATPHIAGLAAILLQAKPTATVGEVESAIFASCVLPSTMTAERANRGIPNGPRALQVLLGSAAAETAEAVAEAVKRRRTGKAPAPDRPKPRSRKVVRK
jgi:subtilisin family serine protease